MLIVLAMLSAYCFSSVHQICMCYAVHSLELSDNALDVNTVRLDCCRNEIIKDSCSTKLLEILKT